MVPKHYQGQQEQRKGKTYNDGGVLPMIMMETQMAMLWDYSKEENHSMPTTNPKEAPMNPVQVSTWG